MKMLLVLVKCMPCGVLFCYNNDFFVTVMESCTIDHTRAWRLALTSLKETWCWR